jgi:CspA family cold shock protein
MTDERRVVTCQRCGKGFVMTPDYEAFLARYLAKVILPVQCLHCRWKAGPVPKKSGQVKWFNVNKGYGFIVDEREQEFFFHQNQIVADGPEKPDKGQTARFHVGYASKGPQALNVELVAE